MVRSRQWDAAAVMTQMATTTLRTLPPPADGILYVIGASTLKDQRGRTQPLGHMPRHSEHDPSTFGFEMVLVMASWAHCRVPIAWAPIAPPCRGHQNTLCRQMLQDFVPPSWARRVVVLADAGFAAHATMRLITDQNSGYVLAMPRTRKLTTGKHLRALVQHWPTSSDSRRASSTPESRRQEYGGFVRHATLHHLGEVTIVRSKKRRHPGPK
jgi:hypothetical protein